MSSVWSERLYTARVNMVVGASVTLVGAGPDETILVYQVCIFNPTANPHTDVRLRISPGGAAAVAYAAFDVASLKSESREERVVLSPGDSLQLRATTAGNYDVNVFGQRLEEA